MFFHEAGIDWEQAACAGLPFNYFFDPEESREAFKEMMLIRPVCMACPIQMKCLKWGFEQEEFGVWGGLTEAERDSFRGSLRVKGLKEKTLFVLNQYGITEDMVNEVVAPRVKKRIYND